MTDTDVASTHKIGPSAWLRRMLPQLTPLAGIAVVLVLIAATAPEMFNGSSLRLLAFQIGVVGITAIGQTFVLLTGGIDLSIGAVIGLTTVIVASQSGTNGVNFLPALMLAAAAGLLVGGVNAALVLGRDVPPFVATFATFVLVQGGILVWTNGAPSGTIPHQLVSMGTGSLLGIPVAAWIFVALAVAAHLILSRSVFGRELYASGSNPVASRMTGIPTVWLFMIAYVLSALLAVLGGVILGGYAGHVDAQLSRTLNLDSIAAAVIGGVALTGGRGRMANTVAGVVLLAMLLLWMIQLGAGIGGQLLIEGAVIVMAAWLQRRVSRSRSMD